MLVLSGNKISLDGGDFGGMAGLESLYLDNNRVARLRSSLWTGIPNLKYLSLEGTETE